MKSRRPNGYVLIAFAAIVTLMIFIGGAVQSPADDPVKRQPGQTPEKLITSLNGPDLFRAYCAPCHGVSGKGGGPVVPALSVQVPDLTTIAKRNGGLFPAERVGKIIAGDEIYAVHGSRDMPIWGPIFHQVERDRDYGYIRLKNVTEHLRSIQQK